MRSVFVLVMCLTFISIGPAFAADGRVKTPVRSPAGYVRGPSKIGAIRADLAALNAEYIDIGPNAKVRNIELTRRVSPRRFRWHANFGGHEVEGWVVRRGQGKWFSQTTSFRP